MGRRPAAWHTADLRGEVRLRIETELGQIKIRTDLPDRDGRPVVRVDFEPLPDVLLDGIRHSRLVGPLHSDPFAGDT